MATVLLEKQLQKEVIDTIRNEYGAYPFRLNAGSFNKGNRFIAGLPQGFPDLMVLVPQKYLSPGKVIFIEMKKEKGKQSLQQKVMQNLFETWGIPYYVVKSTEDLKTIF